MSAVKFSGDSPDDGENGSIVRTYPFTAELKWGWRCGAGERPNYYFHPGQPGCLMKPGNLPGSIRS